MSGSPNSTSRLPESLVERSLAKLGFSSHPGTTLEDLRAVYDAWGRHVPFDNVRKMIHMRSADPGPLPGHTASDFLEAWLLHGTGGTCWAGAGAFHDFLFALGFPVQRGIGTMMAAPDLPPNHGTVSVKYDQLRYLVDTAMLYGEPLLLNRKPDTETVIDHSARGLHCAMREGKFVIRWKPIHRPEGLDCRLERFDASESDFQEKHEFTRGWSPFNHELTARLNIGEEVKGAAFGEGITLHADGTVTRGPMTFEERNRLLIEDLGFSEEIVSQLPPDEATPPPPGSRTAALQTTSTSP